MFCVIQFDIDINSQYLLCQKYKNRNNLINDNQFLLTFRYKIYSKVS